MAQFGPIPHGLCVCHRCDNPLCIAVEHLFLGTQQENVADAVRKGRMAKPGPILDVECVAEIKRRLKRGESPARISRALNVAYTRIYDIKRGRTWADVEPTHESAC